MDFDASAWFDNVAGQESILAYKGTISAEIISELLLQLESKLGEIESNLKLMKKCYNVAVEALQNLFHHTEKTPPDLIDKYGEKYSTFILTKHGDSVYKIRTGNFIKERKVKVLKDRTEQINFLSTDELKILYKIILNNEEFSQKGGGGLGLIDIARKTGNKLVAEFHKCHADYFFFSLEIVIS